MAELLIKAVDATHSDPVKDARGCYKRGDIVLVRPNGHAWGALELKAPVDGGKFVIIKITDVTVAQVRNFVANRWACDPEGDDLDAQQRPRRRRRIRIDADLLPVAVRNALNSTGQFTTTWAAVRQFVRNKETNDTATGATI